MSESIIYTYLVELLTHARDIQASDIHIEPEESVYRIRIRVDGALRAYATHPRMQGQMIINRVKLLAKLDHSQQGQPQDGAFSLTLPSGDVIACRVSTCPTHFGEKMVIRILPHHRHALRIDELGLSTSQQTVIKRQLSEPQGIILVTGPTGSGKTITLYSFLTYLNQTCRHICTLEEPVERPLSGITQVPIQSEQARTFSKTLRALLRADPDILMVGEIRDQETAHITLQAALTGHLILSTLHAQHAIGTVQRLLSLGVAPGELATALQLIIAQRLIRRLCPQCHGRGECNACHDGYQGRIGLFECLIYGPELHEMITTGVKMVEILYYLRQTQAFESLADRAQMYVKLGMTNQAEVQRVLGRQAIRH